MKAKQISEKIDKIVENFVLGKHRSCYIELNFGMTGCFTAAKNENCPMASASLIKLLIAMLLFKRKVNLDYLVPKKDLITSVMPGVTGAFPENHLFSIRELLTFSIVSSDNPSSQYLLNFLGEGAVNSYCEELQLSNTLLARGFTDNCVFDNGCKNTTCAKDCYTLFKLMSKDAIFESLINDILPNVVLNSRIPALLRDKARVAHKTGTLTPHGVFNDVGLIQPLSHRNKAFLCFLTQHEHSKQEAEFDIALASKQVFELLQGF